MTLQCDAEFGASCRSVLASHQRAADALPVTAKLARRAVAEQRNGFAALDRHDPYAALPHFREAAEHWRRASRDDASGGAG